MKRLFTRRNILITISTLALIVCGIIFIYNGLEKSFISRLPDIDNSDKDSYDSVLNLVQTRVNIVDWLIACIGAALTFLAFYVQYAYNNAQQDDLANERYENKLFHLLDVYRDICHNTTVTNAGNGKIAFHYMYYEYKAIFNILESNPEISIRDRETLNYIAFSYFLNGISASKLDTTIPEEILPHTIKTKIEKQLLEMQLASENGNDEIGIVYLKDYRGHHIKHFDGHRPRFIPYIKYITFIIEFIASKEDNADNSINYLIKEQTDHEIGLIYAYRGYNKYISDSDKQQNNKEKTNCTHEKLWGHMYDDIPVNIAHKFKYDSAYFLR